MSTRIDATFAGVVMHPTGTSNPCPRLYFQTGIQLSQSMINDLDHLLRSTCKHVSGVYACMRMPVPSGKNAQFYVSLGGIDPNASSSTDRVAKHRKEIIQVVQRFFGER